MIDDDNVLCAIITIKFLEGVTNKSSVRVAVGIGSTLTKLTSLMRVSTRYVILATILTGFVYFVLIFLQECRPQVSLET